MTYSINFKARLLKEVQIQKYFCKSPAQIVEIDCSSETDYEAVNTAVGQWKGDDFGFRIRDGMKYRFGNKINPENYKVLALTTQNCDFNNLIASKILGLMQLCVRDGEAHVDFLQVKPSTNYNNIFRKYKHIGSALLDFLKTGYEKLLLMPASETEGFYTKQGFRPVSEFHLTYVWKKYL